MKRIIGVCLLFIVAWLALCFAGGCSCSEENGTRDADTGQDPDAEPDSSEPPDAVDLAEAEGEDPCPGVACGEACCGEGESCVDGACACVSGETCHIDGSLVCCAEGTVCYLEACTTPGAECDGNSDCADGEYCEPLLGRCLPSGGVTDCVYTPPAGEFHPEVLWSWPRPETPQPTIRQIISTPMVVPHPSFGPLDPEEPPLPAVIFLAGPDIATPRLRAVSGLDGSDLFLNETDVFGDGNWEIVGLLAGSSPPRCGYIGSHNDAHLAAFDEEGRRLWVSETPVSYGAAAPAIANLFGDNAPEIIVGRSVFASDGTHLWTAASGGEGWDDCIQAGAYSIVADLDDDDVPEIIAGNTAYANNGDLLWTAPVPDGFDATGDFDLDGEPEIVVVHGTPSGLDILSAGGSALCHHASPVSASIGGGPPVVADFNNDTVPEIGVVWPNVLEVVDGDCVQKWQVATTDDSGQTALAVFDFTGDGSAEVVYTDETAVRIFSGIDGSVVLTLEHFSLTGLENPVVADVNNDGRTEVLAVGQQTVDPSMRLFADADRNWVASRPVWNQHTYHVTNVNDVGLIPVVEPDNWTQEGLNNYRQNSAGDRALDVPDLVLIDLRALENECPARLVLSARVLNQGARAVASGVTVAFSVTLPDGTEIDAGSVATTGTILPGESEEVRLPWDIPEDMELGTFDIRAVVDPATDPEFGMVRECDEANNTAGPVEAQCTSVL
jgi:hypothetical protein